MEAQHGHFARNPAFYALVCCALLAAAYVWFPGEEDAAEPERAARLTTPAERLASIEDLVAGIRRAPGASQVYVAELVRLEQDEEPRVARRAVEALHAELGHEMTGETLALYSRLIESGDGWREWYAAQHMWRRDPGATAILVREYGALALEVRRAGMAFMREEAELFPESAPILADFFRLGLAEDDRGIWQDAATALRRMNTPRAHQHLLEASGLAGDDPS